MQGDVTFPPGASSTAGWRMYRGSLRIAGRVDRPGHGGQRHAVSPARRRGERRDPGRRRAAAPSRRRRDTTGTSGCTGTRHRCFRSEDGMLVLRERRRPLGEIATARTSFQTGQVRTTLLARHRRHLQPDRGAADRLRARSSSFAPSKSTSRGLDLRGISPNRRRERSGSAAISAIGPRLSCGRPIVGHRRAGSTARWKPIEDQPLSRPENGWAAFLLQRDYRDYYERHRRRGRTVWVQPIRPSGSRCPSAATTSARCGPRIRGRCSGTATGGGAIR